eukprot:1156420-Pelagomonas_calceolata.AAC.2
MAMRGSSKLHGLRQKQQQQNLVTRMDARLTAVEQQQQQQQQQGLGTEAEEAVKWSEETVVDASNLVQIGHLIIVAPPKAAPPITAEQAAAAAAVGVPLTAVTKHDNLTAAHLVNTTTSAAAAARQKVQQFWGGGAGGGVILRREKTALGAAWTYLVTTVKDRVNGESQRLGLGVTAYAAANSSNVLLTMGTAGEASAGRVPEMPYPV